VSGNSGRKPQGISRGASRHLSTALSGSGTASLGLVVAAVAAAAVGLRDQESIGPGSTGFESSSGQDFARQPKIDWGQFGQASFVSGSIFEQSVQVLSALFQVTQAVASQAVPGSSSIARYELSAASSELLDALAQSSVPATAWSDKPNFTFTASNFGPSLELVSLSTPSSTSSESEEESDWVEQFELALSDSLYVRADSKYEIAEVDPESSGLFIPPVAGGGGGGGAAVATNPGVSDVPAAGGGGSDVGGSDVGGGAAAGGGGGGPVATVMAGAVIDGYVKGSHVFLDLNGNYKFDSGEPDAWTNLNGEYSFETTVNPADYNVVALGGLDGGAQIQILIAPGSSTYVTPISTIFSYADASGSGQGASILEVLGLSVDDLSYDIQAEVEEGGDAADDAATALRTGASLLTAVANAAMLVDVLAGDGDLELASRKVFSTMSSFGGEALNNLVNGTSDQCKDAFTEIVYETLSTESGKSVELLRSTYSKQVDKTAIDVEAVANALKNLDKNQLAEIQLQAGIGQAQFINNTRSAAEGAVSALNGKKLKDATPAEIEAAAEAIQDSIANVIRTELDDARKMQQSYLNLKGSIVEINVDAALGSEGKVTSFDITKDDVTTSGQPAKLIAVGVYDPFALSGVDGSISGSAFSFNLSAATITALEGLLPTGSTLNAEVFTGDRLITIVASDGTVYEASLDTLTLDAADEDGNRKATLTFAGDTVPATIQDESGQLSFLITKVVPDGYQLNIVDNQLEVTIEGQDFKDDNPDVKLPSSFRLTYVVQDPGNPETLSSGMVIAKVKPAAPIIEITEMSADEAGPSNAVSYEGNGYTAIDLSLMVGVARGEDGQIIPSGLGLNGSVSITGLPTDSVLKLGNTYFISVTVNSQDVWVLSGSSISTSILTGDFSGLQVLVPEHVSGEFSEIQARAETRYLTMAASKTSEQTSLSITPVTDGVLTTSAFRAPAPWVAPSDQEEDVTYSLFADTKSLPIDKFSVALVDDDGSEVLIARLSIVEGPGADLVALVAGELDDALVVYGEPEHQSVYVGVASGVDGHAKILEFLSGIDVSLSGHFSGDLNFKLAMGSLEESLFDTANPLNSPILLDEAGAVTFSRTVVPLADTPSLDAIELVIADQAAGVWQQNDYADNPDNPSQSSFFMVPVSYAVSSPDSNEFLYVAVSTDDLNDANATISLNKDVVIEDLTLNGADWKVIPVTAGEEFFIRVPYETFSPVSFRFAAVTRDVDGTGVQTQPAIGLVQALELPFESVPQPAALSILSFSGQEDVAFSLASFLSISPGQGRQLSDLVVEIEATTGGPSLYLGDALVAPVDGKLVADLALGTLEEYRLQPATNSVSTISLNVEVLDPYRDGSGGVAPSSGVSSGQVKILPVADGVDQDALDAYSTTLEMNLEVAQQLNAEGGVFDQIRLLDSAEGYSVRLVLPSGAPPDSALVTVDGVFVMPTVVAASARSPSSTMTDTDGSTRDVYAVGSQNRFGLEAGDYVFRGSREEATGFEAVKVEAGALVLGTEQAVNPYAVEAFLGQERVAYSFSKAQIEAANIQITPRSGLAGLTDVSIQVFTSQGTAIQGIPNEIVLPILVRADAIAPEVQAADVIADEDQVGGIPLTIDLPINDNRVDFEKLGLKVVVESGHVDQGATFTASPYGGTGQMTFAYSSSQGGWTIFGLNGNTPVQFDPTSLTYHPSPNFSGSINFAVTPFAQTADGSIQESSPLNMGLQVNAVAETFTLGTPSNLNIIEDQSGNIDLGSLITINADDARDGDEIMVFEITASKDVRFAMDGISLSPTSSTSTTYSYTLTHPLASLSSLAALQVVPQDNFSTDESGVSISLSARSFEPVNGDQVAIGPVTASIIVQPVPDTPDAPIVVSRSSFLKEYQGGEPVSTNSILLSSIFSLPSLSTGNSDEVVNVVVQENSAFELFTNNGSVSVLTPNSGFYRIASEDFSQVYVRGAQYSSNTSLTGTVLNINTETDLSYGVGIWDDVDPVYASNTWTQSTLYLNPVASGITGSITPASTPSMVEDDATKLWLSELVSGKPTLVDATETLAFYVTVPDFVNVSAKAGSGYNLTVPIPVDGGGARYLIPDSSLANVGLSLSRNLAQDFDVIFSAVSKESNGSVSTASTPVTVSVAVSPVADAPVVSVPSEVSGLISADQAYLKIPLRAYLADNDGSESLQVIVKITSSSSLSSGDVIVGTFDASDPTQFNVVTTTVDAGSIIYTASTVEEIAALSRLAIQSTNDYRGNSALTVEVTATATDENGGVTDSQDTVESFKATVYQEIDPVAVSFGSPVTANFVAEIPITLTAPASLPTGVTPDNLSLLVVLEQVNGAGLPQNVYFATKENGQSNSDLVPVGATLGEATPVWLISGRDLFVPEVDGSVDWTSTSKTLTLITGDWIDKKDVTLNVTAFVSDPDGGSSAKYPANGATTFTVDYEVGASDADPLVLSFDGSPITSVKNDNEALRIDLDGDGNSNEIPTYWFGASEPNYAFFVKQTITEDEEIGIGDLFVDFESLASYVVSEVGSGALADGILSSDELSSAGVRLWSDLDADGIYDVSTETLGLSSDGMTASGTFEIILPAQLARASEGGAIQSLMEAQVVFSGGSEGAAFAVAIPYVEATLAAGTDISGFEGAFSSTPAVAVNPVGAGIDGNAVPEDVASKPGFVITLTEAQKALGVTQDPNHLLKVEIDTGDALINEAISLSAGAKDEEGGYFILTGGDANRTIKLLDLPEHWVGDISVTVTPYASALTPPPQPGGLGELITISGESSTGMIKVVGVPDVPDALMLEIDSDNAGVLRPAEGSDIYLTTDWQAYSQSSNNDLLMTVSSPGLNDETLAFSSTDIEELFFDITVTSLSDLIVGTDFEVILGTTNLGTSGQYTISSGDLDEFYVALNDGVAGPFEFIVQGYTQQNGLKAYSPAVGLFLADVAPVADGLVADSLVLTLPATSKSEGSGTFTLAEVGVGLKDTSEIFQLDILIGGSGRSAADLLAVDGWTEGLLEQGILDEFVASGSLAGEDAVLSNWRYFTYTSSVPGSEVVPPITAEFDAFFNGEVKLVSRANSIELVEGQASTYQYGVAQTFTINPDVSASGFDRSLMVDASNDADPEVFALGNRLLVEEVLDGGEAVVSQFKILTTAFDPDESIVIRPVAGQAAEQYFDWAYDENSGVYNVSIKQGIQGLPPVEARQLSFEYQISEGEGEQRIDSSFNPSSLRLNLDLVKDVTPAQIDATGADTALSVVDGEASNTFLVPLVPEAVLNESDDELYYLLAGVPEWLVPYSEVDGVVALIGFVEDSSVDSNGVAFRTYRISPEEIPTGELFFEVSNRFITTQETETLSWNAVFVEPTNMRESVSSSHSLDVTVNPSPQKPTIYGPGSAQIEEDSITPFDLGSLSFEAGSFSLDTVKAALYIPSEVTLSGITTQTPEQVVVLYAYDAETATVLKGGANRLELTTTEWSALALTKSGDIEIIGSSQRRDLFALSEGNSLGPAGSYVAYFWDKYDFSDQVSDPSAVSWTTVSDYNEAISYEIAAWQELGSSGMPTDKSLIAYRRFHLDYTNVPEDVSIKGLPSVAEVAEGEIVPITDLVLTGLAAGDSVAVELRLPELFIAYRRDELDPTFDLITDRSSYQILPTYVEGGYAFYALTPDDVTTDIAVVGFEAPSGTGGDSYGVSISAQANDPNTGALGAVSEISASIDVIATLDTPELSVQKALVTAEDSLLYSTLHSATGISLTKPLNIAEDSFSVFSYISYSPDVSELVKTTITLQGNDAEKFELIFDPSVIVEEPNPGSGQYIITSASRLPIEVQVQTKDIISDYANFSGSNLLDVLAKVSSSTPDLFRLIEAGVLLQIASDSASSSLIDAFVTDNNNQIGTVVEGFESPDLYLKVYEIDATTKTALNLDASFVTGTYAITGSLTDGWVLNQVEVSGSVVGVDSLPFISIVSESIFADESIVPSNPGSAISSEVHVPIVVRDANDQPKIQDGATLTADFVETEDTTGVLDAPAYAQTGTLTFTDADGDYGTPGDFVHQVTIEPIASEAQIEVFVSRGQISVSTPMQDLLTSRTVEWQYDVLESAIDDLYYGEIETEQYEIIIDDGQAGGINSTTITITLAGDNDLPVISTQTISLSAGTGGNANTLVAVDFTDVDLSQSQDSYFQAGTRSPAVAFLSYTLADVSDGVRLRDSSPVEDFLTVTGVSKAVDSSEGSVLMEAMPLNRIVDFWIKGNSLELNYDVTVNETHDSVARETSATETVTFVVDEFVLPDIAMLADSTGLIEGSLLYRQELFGYDAVDGFSNDFSRFAVSPGTLTVLAQDYVWAISTSELIDGSTAYILSPADLSSLRTIVTTIDQGDVYYLDAGELGGEISTSGYYVLTDSLASTVDLSQEKTAFGLQPFYINLSARANLTAADFVASHGTVVGVTPRDFSYDINSSTYEWVVWVRPDEGTRYAQSAISIAPDSTSGVSVDSQIIREFIHPETLMEYMKVTAQTDGQIGIQWANLTQQSVILIHDMDGNIVHFQGTDNGFFTVPSVLAGQEFVIGWGVHGQAEGPTPFLLEPDSLTITNASVVSSVEALTTGESDFGLQPFYINLSASANVTAADFLASHGTVVDVTPRNFSYDINSSTSSWVVWVRPDEGTGYTRSTISIAPDSTSGVSVSSQDIRPFLHPESDVSHMVVSALQDGSITVSLPSGIDKHVLWVRDEDGRILNYQGSDRGDLTIPNAVAGEEFMISWSLHGEIMPPTNSAKLFALTSDYENFFNGSTYDILDGGRDAYDTGNKLFVDGVSLVYDDAVSDDRFGAGSQDTMRYGEGVWAAFVTGNTANRFEVTGNLGSDGSTKGTSGALNDYGGYSALTYQTYDGYGDNDPSINRIFIYKSNGDVTVDAVNVTAGSDSENWDISGLSGVSDFAYFVLYGQDGSAGIAQDGMQAFMEAAVDQLMQDTLVADRGAAFDENLTNLLGSIDHLLGPGTSADSNFELIVTNADAEPFNGSSSRESYLIWADRDVDAGGNATYDVDLPTPILDTSRSTNILGTDGQDVIFLSDYSDGGLVYGGLGHDIIEGSGGDDMIIASAGIDEMSGGGGKDAFVVSSEIIYDRLDELSDSAQDVLFDELLGQSSALLSSATSGLGTIGIAGFVVDFDASVDSVIFQGLNDSAELGYFEINEQSAMIHVAALDDAPYDTLGIILMSHIDTNWDDVLSANAYIYA
jgi:VCBS repeat-containing protein